MPYFRTVVVILTPIRVAMTKPQQMSVGQFSFSAMTLILLTRGDLLIQEGVNTIAPLLNTPKLSS